MRNGVIAIHEMFVSILICNQRNLSQLSLAHITNLLLFIIKRLPLFVTFYFTKHGSLAYKVTIIITVVCTINGASGAIFLIEASARQLTLQ